MSESAMNDDSLSSVLLLSSIKKLNQLESRLWLVYNNKKKWRLLLQIDIK